MKLLEKDFGANQPGTAKIMAEEPDDMWTLYNLILPDDVVSSETTRKVHLESTKATASRMKLTLHLKVTCRDFHKDSSTLRVRGKNIEHNPFVAAGSFHTITLEPNKPFHLRKKNWNPETIETLIETAENNPKSSSDLAVVLFQHNRAEIHLIGKGSTTCCSRIESQITNSNLNSIKKGANSSFFREVFGALNKHVDFKAVRSVVIASDGNSPVKDEFRRFMLSEARRLRMKSVEESCKTKVVVVGSGNLGEVLGDTAVMNLMKDSSAGVEMRAFRELWDMVCNNSDRACYGPKNVESAHEMRAIETLLISDELYRNDEIGKRKKYSGLVKGVKEAGGKALVYSSTHVSAPQLTQLTGVAAILRFPLPDFNDDDNDDNVVGF
ncbi:hypothetical protein RJT34_19705 [Clitoria ternatea]|uniref:Protein pelota homolog n=1 Tax=Clitoria ternatea TaxID=43366 RepID=A0AAN9IRS3_CLITE